MPGGTAARASVDAIELTDVTKAFGGLTALDNAAIALQNRGASRAAARQRTQPLSGSWDWPASRGPGPGSCPSPPRAGAG